MTTHAKTDKIIKVMKIKYHFFLNFDKYTMVVYK